MVQLWGLQFLRTFLKQTVLFNFALFQAERLFKRALKSSEAQYKKSQALQHHSSLQEAEYRMSFVTF